MRSDVRNYNLFWFLDTRLLISLPLHLLNDLRVHGQHSFRLRSNASFLQIELFVDFFKLVVIVRPCPLPYELSAREKATCLPLKHYESCGSNQEKFSCIQRHCADLSDFAGRAIFVKVTKSVEFTTYEHYSSHTCRESWCEYTLEKKQRHEPRQVLH